MQRLINQFHLLNDEPFGPLTPTQQQLHDQQIKRLFNLSQFLLLLGLLFSLWLDFHIYQRVGLISVIFAVILLIPSMINSYQIRQLGQQTFKVTNTADYLYWQKLAQHRCWYRFGGFTVAFILGFSLTSQLISNWWLIIIAILAAGLGNWQHYRQLCRRIVLEEN